MKKTYNKKSKEDKEKEVNNLWINTDKENKKVHFGQK